MKILSESIRMKLNWPRNLIVDTCRSANAQPIEELPKDIEDTIEWSLNILSPKQVSIIDAFYRENLPMNAAMEILHCGNSSGVSAQRGVIVYTLGAFTEVYRYGLTVYRKRYEKEYKALLARFPMLPCDFEAKPVTVQPAKKNSWVWSMLDKKFDVRLDPEPEDLADTLQAMLTDREWYSLRDEFQYGLSLRQTEDKTFQSYGIFRLSRVEATKKIKRSLPLLHMGQKRFMELYGSNGYGCLAGYMEIYGDDNMRHLPLRENLLKMLINGGLDSVTDLLDRERIMDVPYVSRSRVSEIERALSVYGLKMTL